MFKTMDTDNHPSGSAADIWVEFLNHLQPVVLEKLPEQDNSRFHGRLRLAHLGDLRVSILHATEHSLKNQTPNVSGRKRKEYVLAIPMAGNIIFRQGQISAPLVKDQALLININHSVETVFLSPATCLQIMIPETRVRHLQKQLPEHSPLRIDCRNGLGFILKALCLGFVNGLGNINSDKACHKLGEQLITLLTLTLDQAVPVRQEKSPEQLRLASILTAIDEQLENPDINTDSVAKAAHISKAYLFKLLKRHHTSFRQEVLNRRLDRARQLLKDPNQAHLSVSDIAWQLGFNSHSHFSRTFQKAAGQSPTDFRKQQPGDQSDNLNLEFDFL